MPIMNVKRINIYSDNEKEVNKMIKQLQKGFTLIELLIVIGIIAILAAVVLVGIDPVDKVNNANDSKVQRDISAIANAMEAYAVNNNGSYVPGTGSTALTNLVTAGELKVVPSAPGGYATYSVTGGATGVVAGQLKSKKYSSAGKTWFVWCSDSGRATNVASATTCP
jgi:prepilin-type N-terminal cleavage/methylation domain-containing protein